MEEPDSAAATLTAEAKTQHDLQVKLAMRRARVRDAQAAAIDPEDFELLLAIGHGAFADVFLARQISLERRVAVKLSSSAPLEGSLLAKLNHPNILKVYDQRQIDDGQHMIVMELVPGGSLHTVLRDARGPSGRLTGEEFLRTLDERLAELGEPRLDSRERRDLANMSHEEIVVHLVAQVAAALDHAHSHGVTHCDVKPANILVDASGNIRLSDFNMSNTRSASRPPSDSTVGGTLSYMAPEVLDAFLRSDETFRAEPASDVFSLGVLLWEMLTSARLFQDDPGIGQDERIRKRSTLPVMPDVPLRWRRVYELALECMAADPAKRPAPSSVAAQLKYCGDRALSRYFLRPQSGLRRPLYRWPYLGVVPMLVGSALGAILSAQFSMHLLAGYPPVQLAYEREIPAAIVSSLVFGIIFAMGIIRYTKHTPGEGTELLRELLERRAKRRDLMAIASELGSSVVFLVWAGVGAVKAVAIHRLFPSVPAEVALKQLATTALFGATFASFMYMVAIWFSFDVYFPLVLQHTLEVPPTREWIERTRLRLYIGLGACAIAPCCALAVLVDFGAGNPVGLSAQMLLSGGAIAIAFYLVALAGWIFRTLDEAFARS